MGSAELHLLLCCVPDPTTLCLGHRDLGPSPLGMLCTAGAVFMRKGLHRSDRAPGKSKSAPRQAQRWAWGGEIGEGGQKIQISSYKKVLGVEGITCDYS